MYIFDFENMIVNKMNFCLFFFAFLYKFIMVFQWWKVQILVSEKWLFQATKASIGETKTWKSNEQRTSGPSDRIFHAWFTQKPARNVGENESFKESFSFWGEAENASEKWQQRQRQLFYPQEACIVHVQDTNKEIFFRFCPSPDSGLFQRCSNGNSQSKRWRTNDLWGRKY